MSLRRIRYCRTQFDSRGEGCAASILGAFDLKFDCTCGSARESSFLSASPLGMTRLQGNHGIWAIRPLVPTRNADPSGVVLMALKAAVGLSFMIQRLGAERLRFATKVCARTKTPTLFSSLFSSLPVVPDGTG